MATSITGDRPAGTASRAFSGDHSEWGQSRAKRKAWEWLSRYGPSEFAGTLTAVFVLLAVDRATGSIALAACSAVIGEGLAYYGIIFARDLATERRAYPSGKPWAASCLAVFCTMLVEFGGAEALDVFIRPICLACGAKLGGSVGILFGKIVADVVFYGPVLPIHHWWVTRRRPVRSAV
jgi:hypothetical protein